MFHLALRNLFRNPRRTLAVLLTVSLGSGSLFLFRGFNTGIMNQYRENTIHSRYGHGQINLKGYRDQPHEKPWLHWIENWKSIQEDYASIPGVRHVFPRISFFALLSNGHVTVSGQGQGIEGEQEAPFFDRLNVEEGQSLSTQASGILLGKGLAHALNLKIGDPVTVLANTVHGSMNALDFEVTGIFHTGSKDFDDVAFRIQLPQAQFLLDTQQVESISFGLDSVEDWPKIVSMTEQRFAHLEAIPFAILDKVYYQHSVDWLKSQFGVIQLIILTVVLLGIFNTVSTGIFERKQEIGNLRANGESFWDVLRLLCLEGLFTGAVGSVIGVFLGWLLNATLLKNGILMPPAPGLTRQFHVTFDLQWIQALWTFLLGGLTAWIATWIAGVRVARMKIGEALRAV